MSSFTEGFDKICSKLNCGTLKIKENGINIEKVFVVYQVHSGKISFTHDNYFVKIQSIKNFIKSIEEQQTNKLIINSTDNIFESINYENNFISFELSIELSSSLSSFEITENNKNNILIMFNDFLNWCEKLTN